MKHCLDTLPLTSNLISILSFLPRMCSGCAGDLVHVWARLSHVSCDGASEFHGGSSGSVHDCWRLLEWDRAPLPVPQPCDEGMSLIFLLRVLICHSGTDCDQGMLHCMHGCERLLECSRAARLTPETHHEDV